ncbi:MAG TPA: hypothetical protein VLT79_12360 [Gemmatimonadales bacterium]|nr:hypothetical protein [Gemmatimonadales bacterium]
MLKPLPVSFRVFVTVVWISVAVPACHTMRPVAAGDLTSTSIDRVWVTRTDYSTIIISAPHVTGDTLAGFVDGVYREMLLTDTKSIEQRVTARGRTTALSVGIGAAVLSGMIYMANRNYVGDGQTCYAGYNGIIVPCCAGKSTISC